MVDGVFLLSVDTPNVKRSVSIQSYVKFLVKTSYQSCSHSHAMYSFRMRRGYIILRVNILI